MGNGSDFETTGDVGEGIDKEEMERVEELGDIEEAKSRVVFEKESMIFDLANKNAQMLRVIVELCFQKHCLMMRKQK